MPLRVLERLIDTFRKPKLEPEEREALVAYLTDALRLHRSLNTAFLRLQPILGVAKLRDDREKLAAQWVANGMDYLRDRSAKVREDLAAIVPSVASEVDDASSKHCHALEFICTTGATSFRALMNDASDEECWDAFQSYQRAHKEWTRAKERFDHRWNRTWRRYDIARDEIPEPDSPES